MPTQRTSVMWLEASSSARWCETAFGGSSCLWLPWMSLRAEVLGMGGRVIWMDGGDVESGFASCGGREGGGAVGLSVSSLNEECKKEISHITTSECRFFRTTKSKSPSCKPSTICAPQVPATQTFGHNFCFTVSWLLPFFVLGSSMCVSCGVAPLWLCAMDL